jgi:hypothetical protein
MSLRAYSLCENNHYICAECAEKMVGVVYVSTSISGDVAFVPQKPTSCPICRCGAVFVTRTRYGDTRSHGKLQYKMLTTTNDDAASIQMVRNENEWQDMRAKSFPRHIQYKCLYCEQVYADNNDQLIQLCECSLNIEAHIRIPNTHAVLNTTRRSTRIMQQLLKNAHGESGIDDFNALHLSIILDMKQHLVVPTIFNS